MLIITILLAIIAFLMLGKTIVSIIGGCLMVAAYIVKNLFNCGVEAYNLIKKA